ncbi:hypothetical protein [Thauera sp.]|uniref:phage major capsid protein n=1 Tax=Thauera sp. TaxID=1905334 RepID=UPI002580E6BD|nr:hypothetical protein [Thauera sp.]
MKVIPANGIVGARLIEAAATEVRAVLNLVMRALVQAGHVSEYASPEAVYPDRVVVYKDGRYYAFPFTLSEDNAVTVGAPREVVMQHVDAASRMTEAHQEHAFIEAVGEPTGGVWLIRVIRAGESGNRNYYPDAVLRDAVRLVEGARVFEKSDAEHVAAGTQAVAPGKSFRNLVGQLRNARFVEGAAADTGEIQAELHLIQPDGDVAVRVREAHARGMAGLFGFSIDADAKAKVITKGGRKLRAATQITKVHSVDLIVEPGAGGALLRIVEAQATPSQEDEDMALRQRMIEAIKAHNPQFDDANATDEQIEAAFVEAKGAKPAPAPAPAPAADPALMDQVRLVEARITARDLVGAAKLPQPAKDKLLARFTEAQTPFTAADVSKAIEDERAYLARFTESGKPVIHFDEAPRVEDRSVKIGEMLDGFFNRDGVHSFKECYVEITGDRQITGDLRNCDVSRMRESMGERFVEALSSSSWANVLGDSITRRMLADYAQMTDLQAWRKVADVVPVTDFRTQERTRIGGYGNLPGVNQAAAYTALTSPSDEKATYALTKRGGTESITLEMIANDDVGAIRRLPTEMALAAANTLYEFVMDFIRTNGLIYDGVALAAAGHNNLGAAALDATSFAAARLAMLKQTRAGSLKRLNLTPRTLLVPPELQAAAFDLFIRNQNNDKTFIQTINPEVIAVPYWTDANDWAVVADPRQIPTIEVGFLNGREEPELFVQDTPNVGSLFSNDQVTYKIRHIYSGAVMDYRGFYKAVVA